mgnify:CR=1 FL=1
MTLHLESGSTGQIENAKGNTPRGTIRIDISTHRIVLYIVQEKRTPNLKVDQPVNIENTMYMMTTTTTVQVIVAGRTVTQFRSTMTKTTNTVTMTRGDR